MVGAGNEGLSFDKNTCAIQGREKQHDPMFMKWRYRAPLPSKKSWPSNYDHPPAKALEGKRIEEHADEEGEDSGAQEHADKNSWHPIYDQLPAKALEGKRLEEHADEKGEDSGAQEHADERCDDEASRDDSEHESIADWSGSDEEPPADEAGPSQEEEDSGAEEQADKMKAIGFALAQSAAMLPGLALPNGTKNCIDMARMDTMRSACTEEDVKALEDCMQKFFTRRPVGQSAPPRADLLAARVLKTNSELAEAWRLIMERRRLVERDDARPITDRDTLAEMYTSWMDEWLEENLFDDQRDYERRQQTSIFAAHLNNHYGAKHFVMGLWQTGVQWAPPLDMVLKNHRGALEYVAKNFALWIQNLARAITRHKNHPCTQEARRRSGSAYGKHGLSQEEVQRRWERERARRNYYWTMEIAGQLAASKGKGKRGAAEHTYGTSAGQKRQKKGQSITPKPWAQMSRCERWWLEALWSGELQAEMHRAEGYCSKVQAKDFVVHAED